MTDLAVAIMVAQRIKDRPESETYADAAMLAEAVLTCAVYRNCDCDRNEARVAVLRVALTDLLATLDEHDSTVDTWGQMVKARAALAEVGKS